MQAISFDRADPPPVVRMLPAALLDEIDTGFVVCSGDATVLYANAAARHELSSGERLAAVNGRLAAADDGAFADALAAARLGRRRLLVLDGGGERLAVSLTPVADPGGTALVLVTLGRRSLCSPLTLEMFASCSGMTSAERRVLAGLAAGRSPTELAQEHGVALCTVRTQIKALHDKLGVTSHGALMALLGSLPQLASALRMVPPLSALRRAA